MAKDKSGSIFRTVLIPERCKGCGYCIEFCPQHTLYRSNEKNKRGYYLVSRAETGLCDGCNTCGKICPDFAINTFAEDESED